MNEVFWYLKSCALFEHLEPEQTAALEAHARVKTFARQNLVYLPADAANSLLLLATGRIKIYHITADGKQTVLAIIDPGEVFGELAVLHGGEREEFAETMEKSTVVQIPRDILYEAMQKHAELAVGITKLMGLRRQRIERRLKSLLFRSNRDRLVHVLLELAEQYGEQTADGVLISLRLSHQDLASIIGSTRESVTVALGELQNDGTLIVKRRRVILTDLPALASSIDASPPAISRPRHTQPSLRTPQYES